MDLPLSTSKTIEMPKMPVTIWTARPWMEALCVLLSRWLKESRAEAMLVEDPDHQEDVLVLQDVGLARLQEDALAAVLVIASVRVDLVLEALRDPSHQNVKVAAEASLDLRAQKETQSEKSQNRDLVPQLELMTDAKAEAAVSLHTRMAMETKAAVQVVNAAVAEEVDAAPLVLPDLMKTE
ncbi:hypothetical protein L5515_014517 [Caenorhabditis briggsae]|uniref:Uncharacterized protein n=1 Tax=Caenorhabditis briggsae TaxID=6238 RepID=A0AAE9DLT5_CAEBR|nr:hypothetical protein L3Y34_018395 [Caenorhabditis briggsae]UMM18456.1 hypothetical protein L5515_014517 [Caenorhabditis briggsae]